MSVHEYESAAVCETCGHRACICATLADCSSCRAPYALARLDDANRCEECAADYEDEDRVQFERQHGAAVQG